MRDAWEQMEVRPLEIVDAGNPIVSLGHAHLRARGSGVEFDYPFGAVFWTEQGLIVRELHFSDWDEALRAASITQAVQQGRRGMSERLLIRGGYVLSMDPERRRARPRPTC